MLSGEGNENGEKTEIGLISKKATLHVQHIFFVHLFAIVLLDYNVKLSKASWLHVLWRKCRTCSYIFTQLAASISYFSPPLQKFHVVPPTLSNAPFLVELRWPVALLSLFLCLSLSLFSKFGDMTINLNLIL